MHLSYQLFGMTLTALTGHIFPLKKHYTFFLFCILLHLKR